MILRITSVMTTPMIGSAIGAPSATTIALPTRWCRTGFGRDCRPVGTLRDAPQRPHRSHFEDTPTATGSRCVMAGGCSATVYGRPSAMKIARIPNSASLPSRGPEVERDAERNGSESVAEVMDQVGE